MSKRDVTRYEFEAESYPGGFVSSYGAGVMSPEDRWADECVIGYGRSEREAALDAIERLCTFKDLKGEAIVELEALANMLTDSEKPVEEIEAECFLEWYGELGMDRPYRDLTSGQRIRAEIEYQDSCPDPVEIACALRVAWRSER